MFFVKQFYETPEDFVSIFDGLLIVPVDCGEFKCMREFFHDRDHELVSINVFGNLWELDCCGRTAKCITTNDKQIQYIFDEPIVVEKYVDQGSE